MPRISQLPSLTTADNSDEIAIVDVSASVTKKITRGELLKAPLPNNAVTTPSIADKAVTADKVDGATFPKFKARRSTPLNFPRSSTTLFAVDEVTYNVGGGTFSGGRYTVPITGKYRVASKFIVADNPVTGWSVIFVNGTAYSFQDFNSASNYPNVRTNTTLELNAGDIVDIRFQNEQATRDPSMLLSPSQQRSNELTIEYVG